VLSLTGHPLIGDKLTKFVYLDETGINPSRDKDTIVAGVFINPDSDLDAIDSGLNEVMINKVPSSIYLSQSTIRPEGFVFHAKDYINGTGLFRNLKNREEWDGGKGLEIASAIVGVIEENNIKCVWAKASNDRGIKEAYSAAVISLMIRVDHFMLANHYGEICMVVAEHNDYKRFLKDALVLLKNPIGVHKNNLDGSLLPLKTIKDTVHFVEKPECRAIQLADTVCYIRKRSLEGNQYYTELANRLSTILLS